MPTVATDAAGMLRVTDIIPPDAAPLELFSPWFGCQTGAAPPGAIISETPGTRSTTCCWGRGCSMKWD